MSPALYFARFATGQPKVSLMNQGRSLKDVIGPLVLHLARRNAVKLRIDQAGGLFGGILVTLPHAVQQQGELRWRARRRLLLLVLYHLAIVYSHAKGKGIPARRHEGFRWSGPGRPVSSGWDDFTVYRSPYCLQKSPSYLCSSRPASGAN